MAKRMKTGTMTITTATRTKDAEQGATLALMALTGKPSYQYMFGRQLGAAAAYELDFCSAHCRQVGNRRLCRSAFQAFKPDSVGLRWLKCNAECAGCRRD